jgi:hypothetical protein
MTTLFKLALLGSLAGALLLTNIYLLGAPVETTAIASGVRATGQLAGIAVAGGKAGIEHIEGLTFIQTFSRPLFSRDRRRYEPPKTEPPPKPEPKSIVQKPLPPVEPPNFQLIGISINNAGSRALISGLPGLDPQWFAEGEVIGDWKLTAIADAAITVTHGDQNVSINLYPENR